MKKIILLGGGGHCKSVIDAIESVNEYEIAAIIDKPGNIGRDVCGYKIEACDEKLGEYFAAGIKYCFIAIGSVGNPEARIKAFNLACDMGFILPGIVHAAAVVSPRAKMGRASFAGAGAVINSGAAVGDNCIINTGAIIEHDCVIGDNVHVATGAVLSGGVAVGANSHIGSGACVRQYVKIGGGTIIGSGANVVGDIGDNAVAYGNPCRIARANVK